MIIPLQYMHGQQYGEAGDTVLNAFSGGTTGTVRAIIDQISGKKVDESGVVGGNDSGSLDQVLLDTLQNFLVANEAYQTSALAESKRQADELNEFNRLEAEKVRNFNAEEAAKARAWQERMDNTAYQRLVTDLRSAGLNPILAFQSANPQTGSAASASSGAAARGVQANYASAKNADIVSLDEFLPMLLIPVMSSALQIIGKIADSGLHLSVS